MSWNPSPGILSYHGTFFEREEQRLSFSSQFLSSCGFNFLVALVLSLLRLLHA